MSLVNMRENVANNIIIGGTTNIRSYISRVMIGKTLICSTEAMLVYKGQSHFTNE